MEDRAIERAREAFVSAVRDGDATAVSAVYVDDATLVAPSAQLVRGRPAIEAFWQAGIEAGVCQATLESVELSLAGRLAYEIGRYALQLEPTEGASVVDRGTYLLVHKEQDDGSWLRAVEMFNPDAPVDGRPDRRRDR